MSKGKILIVDDEVHILELLRYNLESNGYQIVEADTGEGALEILKQIHVDLVLLDLMLPGIDGLEVLRHIRQSEELRQLPVVMLTAKK